MAQIIWTEPAPNELNEIAEFIALDKFDAAQKLVKSVFDLEIAVGPCRIFCRTEKAIQATCKRGALK